MKNSAKTVFIVANEASADHHGAKLATELKQADPTIQLSGVGSSAMQHAGVDLLMDLSQYSVIGAVEALKYLKIYRQAFKQIVVTLQEQQPDLLILIDAPAFNLPLAKKAKQLGIKVLYYISPQIWAWKSARIFKIRKYVDMMAVLFKFEEELYRCYQVPVRFVGHPLANSVKPSLSISDARQQFGLKRDSRVIGILPGSRHNELKRLLPVLVPSIKELAQRYANVEFVIPIASTLTADDIQQYFPSDMPDIKLISGHNYDVINCCDTVITCSGTATLEVGLLHKPMVIIYKGSAISYELGTRLIKVKFGGIPNLLANKMVVPEFIQHNANVENIVNATCQFLDDDNYRDTVKQQLQQVTEPLNISEHSHSLVELVLEMLQLKATTPQENSSRLSA